MAGHRKSNHHLPPRLYRRGRCYYYVTSANRWLALGPDLAAAKRKLLDLEGVPAAVATVAEMIDCFLAAESPKRAPRTHQDNEVAAKRLKAFFGLMHPNSVKPSHIAGFLDRHPAPIRANREVATLSSAYSYAMRKGFAERNPCYGVRRNPEKPRRRYVEDCEFDAFLRFAEQCYEASGRKHDGYLMLCVTAEIAYLTGQRREDVLALPLRHVRDDAVKRLNALAASRPALRAPVSWDKAFDKALDQDHGVVLAVRLSRYRRLYRREARWNRGTLATDPWTPADQTANYYAMFGGPTCDGYAVGARSQFSVVSRVGIWPPSGLAEMLDVSAATPLEPDEVAVVGRPAER